MERTCIRERRIYSKHEICDCDGDERFGKADRYEMLEDIGFYCVDNLPVALIEKFAELITTPASEVNKVALGLDVRADQSFGGVRRILDQLKENGYLFEMLFLEAGDDVLLKRYKETRRLHPLSPEGRVEEGIHRGAGNPERNS